MKLATRDKGGNLKFAFYQTKVMYMLCDLDLQLLEGQRLHKCVFALILFNGMY